MKSYSKFWKALDTEDEDETSWFVLHPSLNPTGTNTLRWSGNNPNPQNISKKEGFNLRYCFGPAPGRLWASLDYENIELRIPAYDSGEEVMIEIFEKPNEAPYFGSYHLMNASLLYPDEFWPIADKKGLFKDKYPVLYKRTKAFGFAISYGAVMRPDGWGTADKAVGIVGAHRRVVSKLKRHTRMNEYWIRQATQTGYVETLPDSEICPERGYPIQCSVTKWGKVSPTVPLNYRIQSTAMWIIMRAMIKVAEYLEKVNAGRPEEKMWKMIIQVHDELVFDFPEEEGYQNILNQIRGIMESCGNYINVPLKVSCELHPHTWSDGIHLATGA